MMTTATKKKVMEFGVETTPLPTLIKLSDAMREGIKLSYSDPTTYLRKDSFDRLAACDIGRTFLGLGGTYGQGMGRFEWMSPDDADISGYPRNVPTAPAIRFIQERTGVDLMASYKDYGLPPVDDSAVRYMSFHPSKTSVNPSLKHWIEDRAFYCKTEDTADLLESVGL